MEERKQDENLSAAAGCADRSRRREPRLIVGSRDEGHNVTGTEKLKTRKDGKRKDKRSKNSHRGAMSRDEEGLTRTKHCSQKHG